MRWNDEDIDNIRLFLTEWSTESKTLSDDLWQRWHDTKNDEFCLHSLRLSYDCMTAEDGTTDEQLTELLDLYADNINWNGYKVLKIMNDPTIG